MRTRRVLLVDDERYVATAFQRALADAPYDVEIATTGSEALRRLEQGPIDVMVSDENMPEMRGAELLSRVRERFPNTVRVMMTGDPSLDNAVRAINVGGVFRFLRKPCSIDELRACIDDALAVASSGPDDADALEHFQGALESLWLAAQPIVRPKDQRIIAYELLVRSRSEHLSQPSPLFDLAERLDRVAVLEARILKLVAEVSRSAPPEVQLFVNLHPSTLASPDLLEPLHAIAPRIILEITERAALGDLAEAEARTGALRALGFGIAVDDLGIGHSGLTHVANLRPDVVKLDISLVRGVTQSKSHAGLVSAMARVCDDLDIAVVAEGVETAECRDKLLDLGCFVQQGYLYARPAQPFGGVSWS